MADQVQRRGGTATDSDAFTGADREVTVDTTNKTLRVHDGLTAGGIKILNELRIDPTSAAGLMTRGDIDNFMRLQADVTFNVPTDYPDLQSAVDDLIKFVPNGHTITINIEDGHNPTSGVSVQDGRYGHMVITTSDVNGEVTVAGTFSGNFITATRAEGPTLDCLVNGGAIVERGYYAVSGSSAHILPGAGVKNTAEYGLFADFGSHVSADSSIFTEAFQDSVTFSFGSGILAWGSVVSAQFADVSNSGRYGAQAAAGGFLDFRSGAANGCSRYGVRGTNAGTVNARSASANNCGVAGFRAFDNSTVHAIESSATGSLLNAYIALRNSRLTAGNGTADAANNLVVAVEGSTIFVDSLDGTNGGGVLCRDNSSMELHNCTIDNTGDKAFAAFAGGAVQMIGGSVTGGDGIQAVSLEQQSKLVADGVSFTANNADTQLFTLQVGSNLTLVNGTYTYPNDAINSLRGNIIQLDGTGIPQSDIPGMQNETLSNRGILWGAA